ncbi:MAG: hypothetical protein R6W99_03395 [Clostridia bacterium]
MKKAIMGFLCVALLLSVPASASSPVIKDGEARIMPVNAVITETGLYARQHGFHNAGGYPAVEIKIPDFFGNPVFSDTLFNPGDNGREQMRLFYIDLNQQRNRGGPFRRCSVL